jgi:hypothetical protein
MAMAKKSLRRINVDNIGYLYKVSRGKSDNRWRALKEGEEEEFDEAFIEYARYYDLGQILDTVISITIELEHNPKSRLFVKIHTITVMGFLGIEPFTNVTPKFVAKLIKQGLHNGWSPSTQCDVNIGFIEKRSRGAKPTLLLVDVY